MIGGHGGVMPEVPPALFQEINRGNCVAFVGAGFSAAAGLPGWRALLRSLAQTEGVEAETRAHVLQLLDDPGATAHALDQAAQMMADELEGERFVARLREILRCASMPERMMRRLRWLQEIPFRAVLTTNFDGVLARGDPPEARSYRRILRDERPRWWQKAFWDAYPTGAPTLHLHGDLRSPADSCKVVFTREDYRRRLYSDPAYVTFLRSVFSTSTLLYLGFSFTDAYLNELRSEILALLGYAAYDRPLAYAVLNDVSRATCAHFRRHEGIEVLGFDSSNPPGFQGFDEWLSAIHAATCPVSRFGKILAGKRILWMDPNRDNNIYGVRFLERAAELYSRGLAPIVMADSPAEALARLDEAQRAGGPFDLTISYWGREDEEGVTPGGRLLQGMRAGDLRSPVLIFAGTHNAENRKREALRLGAQAYCYRFESLFSRIEEIFAPVEETW
jgi:CheY-like chemotaxis protein